MGFFLQIHRSIIDPSFYAEIKSLRVKNVCFYWARLLTLTVVVLAFMTTLRVVDREKGLPALLPALFPGMRISANGMVSTMPTPYVVNPVYGAEAISLFTNTPVALLNLSDSAIVVDERTGAEIDSGSSVPVRLTADLIIVTFSPEVTFSIPYSMLLTKDEVLTCTPEGVAEFLKHRYISIFIGFCVQYYITFGINIILSIFFLSFAAFIFKSRQIENYALLLKMSSFAVTPLAIESILVAIAGVQFVWLWQIGIFISVFVLYRGVLFITMTTKENPRRGA